MELSFEVCPKLKYKAHENDSYSWDKAQHHRNISVKGQTSHIALFFVFCFL